MQANFPSPFIVEGVRILCKDGETSLFQEDSEVGLSVFGGRRSPYVVLNISLIFPQILLTLAGAHDSGRRV